MVGELCCALKGRQTARTQSRLGSLRGLLYFTVTSGITVATNNLKEGLTKPVTLEGNVGKSQNGIMYHFYLFLAIYCKKEMIQQKKNWPGCKHK